MVTPLRLLLIEDSEDDAFLIIHELHRAGYFVKYERVQTAASMESALKKQTWDIITCDYSMPHFSGINALKLLRAKDNKTPFIFVSGIMNEDMAVTAMKEGANDYVLKANLKRLVPTIEREMRETKEREALHSIEEKEVLFQNAFDHAANGMALVSAEGRFLQANQALCDLVGYSCDEFLSSSSIDLILSKEDTKELITLFNELISSKKPCAQFEKSFKHKSGSLIQVILNITLVLKNNSRSDFFICQFLEKNKD